VVPGRGQREKQRFDRSVPATVIAGGEGGGVEKHYHIGAPLGVARIGSG
jgi:hypothetical protein